MGQAKNRGTIEERKATAIERDKILAAQRADEENIRRLVEIQNRGKVKIMDGRGRRSPGRAALMRLLAVAAAAQGEKILFVDDDE